MSVVLSDKNIVTEVISSIEKSFSNDTSLLTLRKEAVQNLQRLGLPTNKSEEYKYTPITRLLEKNFTFSKANPASNGVSIADVLLKGVTGNVIVFINGVFSAQHSTIVSAEGTIKIISMAEAAVKYPLVLNTHLAKFADHSTDPFTAWNTAAWTDGLFIEVPDKAVVSEPVLIYHINDASAGQVITASRNLILVGKSSEVTVVEKFDSFGSENSFSSVVTEGIVKENGSLQWYSIQNDQGNRYQFDHKYFHQSNSSRVNTYTFSLSGKLIRNNLQLAIDGEGIDSHMYGLYLLNNDTIADNHTVVDHRQPNSFSNEMYKGIMDDSSKGVFNGKIYVRPNAQKTNAFQANRNILLSDKAVVNTKPQLEIWADDVKCSHGCTSGQLDEEAMFYLRARGISKDTARAMMLYAFVGQLLENIKNPSLRDYIDNLVSERLHKNF